MNTRELCLGLLNILDDADGHPLTEDVIGGHFKLRLGRDPKLFLKDGLETLQGRGHAAVLEPEFADDDTRWVITTKGKAWLAAQ